jgi:ankyrin repeat protein
MHLNSISLEPNSSYVAEGRHSMGQGAAVTSYQIKIETDEVGRVRSYSDGPFADKSLADMWDYQKLRNVTTGKVWDLRLFTAALNGNLALAETALAEGADVNLRMKQGATALHWSAAKGREKLAQLLLEHGADVNAVDEHGWLPAFLAAANNFQSMVDLFIAHGSRTKCNLQGKEVSLSPGAEADPNGELLEAIERGDLEAVKAAISAGADVNSTFRDGWSALLVAANQDPRITELLLGNGADPNVPSDRGYTPLMRAAGLGKPETVRLLLAGGADKDMRDCDGKNACRLAQEMRQFACADMVK